MNLRLELKRFLALCFMFSSAYMTWQAMSLVANSHSPIVVVLSGSMEPAFQRGDVLFLWNRNQRNKVGDIVVYEVEGKQIPIVHRVLREHSHTANPGKQFFLTKGDNNAGDDIPLYSARNIYLNKEKDIVGTVVAYVPLVGYATIGLNESEKAKYAIMGLLGLSALLSGEE